MSGLSEREKNNGGSSFEFLSRGHDDPVIGNMVSVPLGNFKQNSSISCSKFYE
jgi:hypothetical protein